MLPSRQAELELLTEAVRAAGEVALTWFGGSAKVWTKGNDSPVSDADIAVEETLLRALRGARPDYGWLSEETVDDGSRLVAKRTFVVDPVDGTRSFIAGGTDWTIPIAIIEAGRPIAAALLAPCRHELYQATSGGGAVLNGEAIRVSDRAALEGATLSVSRRLLRPGHGEPEIGAKSVFFASLAYRLARIADGRLDGAAIKAEARDWDLAAADLLVQEAGGLLCDLDGRAPRYDRAETNHPPLVAGPPALQAALVRLTRKALSGAAPPTELD